MTSSFTPADPLVRRSLLRRSVTALKSKTVGYGLIGGALAATALIAPLPVMSDIVLYNNSPSMPVGLYIRSGDNVERNAIVTVRAADVASAYARERGFAGHGDRFIKRVAGVGGDRVCADRDDISLSGVVIAHRQQRDSSGRELPFWLGCRVLGEHQVFLLGETRDSFDGRYWGVVKRSEIEGVWRPLLVKNSGNE